MPLSRLELDLLTANGCRCPGCLQNTDLLFLSCRQHPRVGVQVSYARTTGLLSIDCRICRENVVALHIAES